MKRDDIGLIDAEIILKSYINHLKSVSRRRCEGSSLTLPLGETRESGLY